RDRSGASTYDSSHARTACHSSPQVKSRQARGTTATAAAEPSSRPPAARTAQHPASAAAARHSALLAFAAPVTPLENGTCATITVTVFTNSSTETSPSLTSGSAATYSGSPTVSSV